VGWRLAPSARAGYVPTGLREVLRERLRQMAEELRNVLYFASVEGESFSAQVVSRLCRLDEYKIYDDLKILEERYRLVQEQGVSDVGAVVVDFYRFIHRFFREYVYGELAPGKRRDLHRHVGECLEALYSDHRPIAGQLALHFREAREHLRAARYTLEAAQYEQDRYSWSEMAQWCELGLGLLRQLPANSGEERLRLDLLECLGHAHYSQGNYSLADQSFRQALDVGAALQLNAEYMAHLYERIADVCEYEGRPAEALNFLELARSVLRDEHVPVGCLYFDIESQWALLQARLGNSDVAVECLRSVIERAGALLDVAGIRQVLGSSYNALGVALFGMGRYADAGEAYRQAIEWTKDLKGAIRSTYWLNLASDSYFALGNLEECIACANQGLQIARAIGSLEDEAFAYAVRGEVLLAQDNPREALVELTRAVTLAEQIGSAWDLPALRGDMALAHLALGDTEQALQLASRAVDEAGSRSVSDALARTLDVLARVQVARQEWDKAEACFQEALVLDRRRGDHSSVAHVQVNYAHALADRGERRQAATLLQAALDTFRAQSLEADAQATLCLLGALPPAVTTDSGDEREDREPAPPVRRLARAYASRFGAPVIDRVEFSIFTRRYPRQCMDCAFCQDACCSFGADVDAQNISRLEEQAAGLEAYTGVPREQWFAGERLADAEFPGNQYMRLRVIARPAPSHVSRCVFLRETQRGCMLHGFCLDARIDYHSLKPMVCCLFPLTFDEGLLHPAKEVDDNSLVCLDRGTTLYRGLREELQYYFGEDLIRELDVIEEQQEGAR
jgi:tetratricopeptide (TPR) repeat protein/Fe-S-cluster containining protein